MDPLQRLYWGLFGRGIDPFQSHRSSAGITALPFPFFFFLTAATGAYLAMVEVAKRRLFRGITMG